MSYTSSWVKYLDALTRYIVHNRYNACCWCKKPVAARSAAKLAQGFDAHHHFPKGGHRAIRWDTRHIFLLCNYCHRFRMGSRPQDWTDIATELMGGHEKAQLIRYTKHSGKQDYKLIELSLLAEIDALGLPHLPRPKQLQDVMRVRKPIKWRSYDK